MDVGKLLQEVSHVEKKKWQRERKREQEMNPIAVSELMGPTPAMLRRRGSKRGRLTPADKISIAYQAMVKMEKQADIAKAFRTSQHWVSRIVKQVSEKEGALSEIVAKRDEIEAQKAATK